MNDYNIKPAPMAATRNAALDTETPKSELIREWVGAVNENMAKQDTQAAVTLYCIRCKNFNPNDVIDCVYNGCTLFPVRTKGLKLDVEFK